MFKTCYLIFHTHFLLSSLSAGMIVTSDSSSSSCFKTDGAFTVTLLSLTVAPRFLPALNKSISQSTNYGNSLLTVYFTAVCSIPGYNSPNLNG